jgi:hypothetical protein
VHRCDVLLNTQRFCRCNNNISIVLDLLLSPQLGLYLREVKIVIQYAQAGNLLLIMFVTPIKEGGCLNREGGLAGSLGNRGEKKFGFESKATPRRI